ncbi:DUF6653 family protein [Halovenus salina]|uniref:DUF6653 family protein n=1 Tax=Halovenus salina TaxID=1510225 RepID=A0ABD5W2S1_9EURY|nr:DUF6653 family protein [Halovenus salina]
MNVEKSLARLFGLEGERWLRHANPKSVYSRFPVLVLIAISVWSRVWVGRYFLAPLVATLLWTFLNPRLFSKPDSFTSWATKGVLGERIWKERDSYDIPTVWAWQTHALNAVQLVAMGPFLFGLYELQVWMTITGLTVAFLGKIWFFDRMVWLFEDRRENETVREWIQ